MPKEFKKRGRRAEAAAKKRKHGADDEHDATEQLSPGSSKRRKSAADTNGDQQFDESSHYVEDESMTAAYPPVERPFFGMLDDEEQEFFKSADETLEANVFVDNDQRKEFLTSIYREAEGKELKLANSQSCSRLMERLIQLSSPSQLKNLFQKFSGNFIHLMAHRFASHCVEQLFVKAAPYVTEDAIPPNAKHPTGNDEIYVSMENLFLHAIAELEGSAGFVMTDRFASHALRILLLVLSGDPITEQSSAHLLASKRKEGVLVDGAEETDVKQCRKVPASFAAALEKLIGDSVAGLDTDKLRALAVHPNANPVLQLLLKIELSHFGKQRAKDGTSLFRKLIPDDPITEDCESAAFINGLVYDQIGSHLVETMVECAPGKQWKAMYKAFFKERLASFARNEVATYVTCRVLQRLGKDDLLDAHEQIVPNIPSLLGSNRTLVVRTLIERCAVREIDTQAIAVQFDAIFAGEEGFDITKLLKVDEAMNGNHEKPHDSVQSSADSDMPHGRPSQPVRVHFNVLAQAMLRVPGSLSALILDSLVEQTPTTILRMAYDPIMSRTLQAAITSKHASIIQTRKIIQHLYGRVGEMALDKAASHVVDCVWEGTHGLAFIRERIAEELAENEAQLRESPCGRGVWRNWKMDIYKRRRGEWVRQSKIKASNDGFQSFSELEKNKAEDKLAAAAAKTTKTPLQVARERHAKTKAEKEKNNSEADRRRSARSNGPAGNDASPASNANRVAVPPAAAVTSGLASSAPAGA